MIESVRLESVPCPLCHGVSDDVVCVGRDLIHEMPGAFTVVKCRGCGLIRTNPRPSPESIGQFYPDDYGPYLGTRVNQASLENTSFLKRWGKRVLGKLFQFNTANLPALPPGKMLEVGCASGAFLHKMAAQGWNVEGIEFSETAARAACALGYKVHAGPLETAPKPDQLYDLIVAWMVLEHLHQPIIGLKKLRECAKSDAWLVFSVPNAGALEFRIFKDKWYALHLPAHMFHFTPETIDKILLASGWKVEKIFHQRVVSSLVSSIGYVLCDKGFDKLGRLLVELPKRVSHVNYFLYPIAWLMSLLGQTGRMTVWAKPLSEAVPVSGGLEKGN